MRAMRLCVFLRHPRQGFRIDVNAGRKLSAGFRAPDEQHAHGLRPSLAALDLCDLGQPAKLQRGERSDQHEDSERSDDFNAEHFSLRMVRVLFPQFKIVFRESVDVPGVTKLRISKQARQRIPSSPEGSVSRAV
jgi:hypothetical protein